MAAAAMRAGLLPPPPPLPDEVASADGSDRKGLWDHKVSRRLAAACNCPPAAVVCKVY